MKSASSTRSASDRRSAVAAHRTSSPERNAAPSQHGCIKHVLACIDGSERDKAVLDQALQVALRFGSHVDVLHVRFDVHGTSVHRHERRIDRLLDEPVESAVADAAVHARRHFEEWQATCKLPLRERGTGVQGASSQWREIIGYEEDVIARLGRLSDMIVVARAAKGSSTFSALALEAALFETGRPVLLAPYGAATNVFHRPLIAWNGSREAARAVNFALPFLTEFTGCIDIFAAPESKHYTDVEELLCYLSWHGIVGERISSDVAHPTGMSLLAAASANNAGLIVMGAYTHGHYRQFLFGGMTRYVMEHAAIPILFAH
jgi:nucleotide-binding universal stress UspA family protein